MGNNLNPEFLGRVRAAGFEGLHNKGVSATCVSTNETTDVNVFGTTNGFEGVVTGVFLWARGGIASTITLKGDDGATIASIAKGTATGVFVGEDTLANTTFNRTGTMIVVGTGTASTAGRADAYVVIFYRVTED